MVRTMSESMMRRVAVRCGAHRLQAPSGARLHGSTGPRVHGFTGSRAWERPSAGRGWRRAFPMPGTRRRNVSFDPHVYERTAPPIIESEFLQSNNRGAVQLRPRGRTSPCSRCKRKGRAGNPLSRPAFSTGLPWPYFLCRAVSVWFPRRRNSINPTPKSVNAANATMGAFTPVLASWRIVFTMAGVTGGM